jgi:hypothetical protein
METCNNDHKWDTQPNLQCEPLTSDRDRNWGRYSYREGGRDQAAQETCTPGLTRCNADGKVERCTDPNTWKADLLTNCRR